MTTYGTLRFNFLGDDVTAELTEEGWRSDGPAEVAGMLGVLADPREFGAADGDPMAAAVIQAAGALKGTYELADLPGAPPEALY